MTACDADDLSVDYVVIEDREILYPSEKRIPLIADNWDCSPPASELILVVGDELVKSLISDCCMFVSRYRLVTWTNYPLKAVSIQSHMKPCCSTPPSPRTDHHPSCTRCAEA